MKIKTVEERELAICAKEKELADREAQVNEKANTSKGVVRLKDVAVRHHCVIRNLIV